MERDLGLRWTNLSYQRIKLIDEGHGLSDIDHEPGPANHVHQLDALEHIGCCAKGLAVQNRPGYAFDRAVVLLEDIMETVTVMCGTQA